MTRQEEIDWMASIEVGSLVEDCRYEVVEVKEIYREYWLHPSLYALMKTVSKFFGTYDSDVLLKMHYLSDFLESIPGMLGTPLMPIFDAHIVTEDGFGCSLRHCCSPPPKERKK